MNNYINEICELEEHSGIYDIKINDIPIWRLVYRRFRDRYLFEKFGIVPMSSNRRISILNLLKSALLSFFQLLKILILNKSYSNLIFGFPRLEKINGIYIDKLCDPLINYSCINKSFIYFERGRSGYHFKPRYINSIVWTEFLDFSSSIISSIIFPIIYVQHRNSFDNLFDRANRILRMSICNRIFVIKEYSKFIYLRKVYMIILKRLRVKNVLSVTIHNKPALISACKYLKVKCIEIQHGITEGETAMYSGKMIPSLSPDYFFAFGKNWINDYFNIPKERIINVGYAFKCIVKSFESKYCNDSYLIISSPEISEEILNITLLLKDKFPQIHFVIRLHPMDRLNSKIDQIRGKYGIEIDDNTINSNISILKYAGVLGENSTVLYESISLGKKTAKFHFNGLNDNIDINHEVSRGFFILNSVEDFSNFISYNVIISNDEYYSDFKPVLIENLLK